MSAQDVPRAQQQSGRAASSPEGEEELRAAYEAELSRLTATDIVAQATVSLLNIGARRLAPASEPAAAGERDLEQVRDAIDAARALLEILHRRVPQELRPMRDMLSQLQMAYAREVGAGAPAPAQAAPAQAPAPAGPGGAGPAERGAAGEPEPADSEPPRGPGPAEASGRLWVPGR